MFMQQTAGIIDTKCGSINRTVPIPVTKGTDISLKLFRSGGSPISAISSSSTDVSGSF